MPHINCLPIRLRCSQTLENGSRVCAPNIEKGSHVSSSSKSGSHVSLPALAAQAVFHHFFSLPGSRSIIHACCGVPCGLLMVYYDQQQPPKISSPVIVFKCWASPSQLFTPKRIYGPCTILTGEVLNMQVKRVFSRAFWVMPG